MSNINIGLVEVVKSKFLMIENCDSRCSECLFAAEPFAFSSTCLSDRWEPSASWGNISTSRKFRQIKAKSIREASSARQLRRCYLQLKKSDRTITTIKDCLH